MKSLDQIEPRTDLQNAPASAVDTTNAAYHFIINQPASYYLTANIAATKTNGIEINSAGATLDLNGFQISRASGSGGNGIEIAATAHGTNIRNGSVVGFTYGIKSDVNITTRGSRNESMKTADTLLPRWQLDPQMAACQVTSYEKTTRHFVGNSIKSI